MVQMTTRAIAERVDGELIGDGSVEIRQLSTLDTAAAHCLSFIGDAKYAKQWPESRAAAALVITAVRDQVVGDRPVIVVDDVDLAMALLLEDFAPPWPSPGEGVDSRAVIDPTAELGEGVQVGPNTVIGPRVKIGAGVQVHANVTVLADVVIGAGCVIWPGVVIRERCRIGQGCILHPNVVIGADGFGYRPAPDGGGIVKIPQIGTVEIGNGVEIGAGTCVDRGKFDATVIGDGTKIDNLCQIGHNCRIGRCCIIVGMTGVAGSVVLEDGVTLGGRVSLRDHIHVGAGATVAACAAVMNHVPAGRIYMGYPAREAETCLKEHAAMRKLPDLVKMMKREQRRKRKEESDNQ